MPISAGDRLGPYAIESPIGEGGMGAVWKARDTRLDRIVAIKVAKPPFSANCRPRYLRDSGAGRPSPSRLTGSGFCLPGPRSTAAILC